MPLLSPIVYQDLMCRRHERVNSDRIAFFKKESDSSDNLSPSDIEFIDPDYIHGIALRNFGPCKGYF
jgi:hypothetical protein